MEVFGFKIRKLSVYNGVSWHHFPHRSDLSIHFLKEKDGISTSILWKGTTLVRVTIQILSTRRCLQSTNLTLKAQM